MQTKGEIKKGRREERKETNYLLDGERERTKKGKQTIGLLDTQRGEKENNNKHRERARGKKVKTDNNQRKEKQDN